MTKNEEIALYVSIVASLPDGYVRDILADLQPAVERAIENDLGHVDWRHWEKISAGLAEDCARIRGDALELGEQFNAKKREFDRLERELSELRSQARTVSRLVLS
jgi:hypothetical protein